MNGFDDSSLNLDKLPEGIGNMIRAIAGKPDFPERLARLALILRQTKLSYLYRDLALHAWRLAPADPRVRYLTYRAVRESAPQWHFTMVHDFRRNEAYARALGRFVRPNMLILEIGAGTGLLAMLAARAGAAQVITCEKEPLIAEQAKIIIARNGLTDRVTVVPKELTELTVGTDLPQRADLLVAEMLNNNLLGDQVLPLYVYARKHLLAAGGQVLPETIAARGMLVGGLETESFRMGQVLGFDLSPFNLLSPPSVTNGKGGGRFDAYSEPVEIFHFDLNALDHPERGHLAMEIVVTRDGLVQGFMQWIWMDFGGGITFENPPHQESHWWPVIHLFPEEMAVRAGHLICLTAEHDQRQIMIWPEV
jgi:hypothetical protein